MSETIPAIRHPEPDEALAINGLVAEVRAATYFNPELRLDEVWQRRLTSELLSAGQVAECQENVQRSWDDPEHYLYLVIGRVAGVLYAEQRPEEGVQEIHRLHIHAALRNRGVGTAFMRAYDRWSNPTLRHMLEVVPDNKLAIRFYERFGYWVKPGSEQTFPDGVTTITMQKPAKEPGGIRI